MRARRPARGLLWRRAIPGGASEDDADAHACRQIQDWERMAQDVWACGTGTPGRVTRKQSNRELNASSVPSTRCRTDFEEDCWCLPTSSRHALCDSSAGENSSFTGGIAILAGARHRCQQRHLQRRQWRLCGRLPIRTRTRWCGSRMLRKYGRFSVAPATFLDWRQTNAVFEHIGAVNSTGGTLVGNAGADRVAGGLVSWDMFDIRGVAPALDGWLPGRRGCAPGSDSVIHPEPRDVAAALRRRRRHPRRSRSR